MKNKSPRSKNRIEGNKYYVFVCADDPRRREIFMCKRKTLQTFFCVQNFVVKQKNKRKACGKCVGSGKMKNIPPKMCY